jgi:2-dehydro-3-deoxyphosphogluconate aldolase/(4S)-4-hydroxy-2-oxoglutarate aldolase
VSTHVAVARPAVPSSILASGVLAIGRRPDPANVRTIADALAQGGIRAFELTLNEPQHEALRMIEAIAATGILEIGAGTVLSIDVAQRAVDAGATFLVTPHTDIELVAWAADRGIPIMPGAFTPTEVLAGWRAGAAAIKVFPASVAGPSFIRELRGPLPDIGLVPTGGVSADNVADFIRAGARAVGVGSWLTGSGSEETVRQRVRQIMSAVAEARTQ